MKDSDSKTSGILALVGGREWTSGCEYDKEISKQVGADTVLIIPAALAFGKPQLAKEQALKWYKSLSLEVDFRMIFTRNDTDNEDLNDGIENARFVYLPGGSPLHLRSVLKGSVTYRKICNAFKNGAALVASSAGAMVLGDPMVDPRGGAYTVGLGLIPGLASLCHFDHPNVERTERSIKFAPKDVFLAGIPETAAIVRNPDGTWYATGKQVSILYNGIQKTVSDLNILSINPEA